MVGPTIIHHTKSADTYESAIRCIVKKCNLENKSEIHTITDGEPALIVACLKSFSKCSLLRCTRHFEVNFKGILIGMGIKGNMKNAILDVVFGEHGLVEAENKQDLKEKMKDAITLLSEMEKQCLPQNELMNNNVLFSSYIESREKTILREIIRSSRRKTYHISRSQAQKPLTQCFLQKKVSLAYSKKDDIVKSHFVKYVWKSTVDHQSLEIESALTNQSAQYRLSEEAQYLAIPTGVWY